MFPGVTAVTNHLARNHKDIWETYVLTRDAKKNSMVNIKKEELVMRLEQWQVRVGSP